MNKLTTQIFIDRSNKSHDFKYDYSISIYDDCKSKIQIICPTHGIFTQSASGHMSGKGCRRCAKQTQYTTSLWIEEANKIHNFRYDYSLVDYKDSKTKLKIKCLEHGVYETNPNNHLRGKNCPLCSRVYQGTKRMTQEEFIINSQKKHNYKFNYDNIKYKLSNLSVTVTCPIHGEFDVTAGSHLHGTGCKYCTNEKSQGQKYKNKETTIYYVYLPEFDLYKIGLTQTSIAKRFRHEPVELEVISSKLFKNGLEALILEQLILSKYRNVKYNGNKILISGNTELFTEDILKAHN